MHGALHSRVFFVSRMMGRGLGMFRLFLFIFPIISLSEPDILWFEEFSGSGEESIGHYILTCEDNGFLQVGETYDYSNLSSKIFVVKLNSNGQFNWSREIYVGEHNLGNSAIELNNGYLILGGIDQNSALILLNKEDGSTIFLETFDNGGIDAFEHATSFSGGIAAVGYVYAADPLNTFYTEGQGYIMFLDDYGNAMLSQNLSEFIDQAYRVQNFNNELIISGLSEGAYDYKVIKMSLEGDVIWHFSYGGNNEEHCFGMDMNDNGDIFLSGHTLSETQNWDTYTVKINNNGDLIWANTVGNPRGFNPEYIHDEAWGIKATNDGGCVTIAGTGDEYDEYSECDGQDCSDIWNAYLIKFNDSGDVSWQKTFSSYDVLEETNDWAGEAIDLTHDGGAIIAIDNGQFGFLRVNNIQNMLINDFEKQLPNYFRLDNNYPNPFNPSTIISYSIPNQEIVKVNIYNVKGDHIIELFNNFKSEGVYSIDWNGKDERGSQVSAGVYFYDMKAGEFWQTKKMILLK